jgi:Heterokaryon incompatibility protein (HET)
MTTVSYRYLTVDNYRTQIRLLELHPGRDSSPICTTLHTINLDRNTGAYEALSYSWGPPGGEISIMCRSGDSTSVADTRFMARPNLYAALNHLRYPFESRFLWIDAVCINQKDEKEKVVQLKLMTRIYQECRQVVIWLGEGDWRTSEALKLVPKLVQASRILGGPISVHKYHPSQWERLGLPREHEQVYKDFQSLVNRDWFTRIWTVQESAVCGKATVLVGNSTVDWDEFLMGVRCIQDFVNGWTPNVWEAFQQCKARQVYLSGRRPRLLSLLLRHQHRDAGRHNDKIAGLLGISQDGFGMGLASAYPLPTTYYYKCFALACLEKYRKLDIFAATRSLEGITYNDLPTWVPDWSQFRGIPFITLNGYEFENNEETSFSQSFRLAHSTLGF